MDEDSVPVVPSWPEFLPDCVQCSAAKSLGSQLLSALHSDQLHKAKPRQK
jgi:hypothetical protein